MENNNGQADITSSGDGENCEVEMEATEKKSKSKGKERYDTMILLFRLKYMLKLGS